MSASFQWYSVTVGEMEYFTLILILDTVTYFPLE